MWRRTGVEGNEQRCSAGKGVFSQKSLKSTPLEFARPFPSVPRQVVIETSGLPALPQDSNSLLIHCDCFVSSTDSWLSDPGDCPQAQLWRAAPRAQCTGKVGRFSNPAAEFLWNSWS